MITARPRLTSVRVDFEGATYRLDTYDPAMIGPWLRTLADAWGLGTSPVEFGREMRVLIQ